MANRAYLYSVDSDDYANPDNWERSIRDKLPYYDSRWNIPYAWFFLFRSADVKMIDVYSSVYSKAHASSEGSHWQEVKFFAPKATALRAFAERRPLLLKIASSPFISDALLDHFAETVAQHPGECLIMDPSEVFGGFIPETDEENFAHCTNISGAARSGKCSGGGCHGGHRLLFKLCRRRRDELSHEHHRHNLCMKDSVTMSCTWRG